MSDYAHKPKGGLKFKGEGEKKKKKKSSTTTDRSKVDAEIAQKEKEVEKRDTNQVGSSSASGSGSGSTSTGGRRLTESERRFEEVQKKRREERARKNAHLSHKERVSEFNSKLDRLTEHHDMPKIGPG